MSDSSSREHEHLLVQRARKGHEDSLRELVDLHKDRLFAFIWRMSRNHHDAEEICQEAFLKAFAALDSFSIKYRFSTWLFTIGYRIGLNRMRRRRPLGSEVDWDGYGLTQRDSAVEVVESEEVSRIKNGVWRAVDRLSPPQRAAVLLFYRHSMGCREISRVLELPVATVKSHLHRARNRLREMLESLPDADLQSFRNFSQRTG